MKQCPGSTLYLYTKNFGPSISFILCVEENPSPGVLHLCVPMEDWYPHPRTWEFGLRVSFSFVVKNLFRKVVILFSCFCLSEILHEAELSYDLFRLFSRGFFLLIKQLCLLENILEGICILLCLHLCLTMWTPSLEIVRLSLNLSGVPVLGTLTVFSVSCTPLLRIPLLMLST